MNYARSLLLLACCLTASAQLPPPPPPPAPCQTAANKAAGIVYHGGPVMSQPMTIYPILYGETYTAQDSRLLQDLTGNFGSGGLWNVARRYCDAAGNPVTSSVTGYPYISVGYAGSIVANPTAPTDAELEQIIQYVANAISNDNNAAYIVILSSEVTIQAPVAGYHSTFKSGLPGIPGGPWSPTDTWLHYAVVSLALSSQRQAPGYLTSLTPNGDPTVDGSAWLVAHELIELAIDPQGGAGGKQAWDEIADPCTNSQNLWSYPYPYRDGAGAPFTAQLFSTDTTDTTGLVVGSYRNWLLWPVISNSAAYGGTCQFAQ
jgi:hypothetical protein